MSLRSRGPRKRRSAAQAAPSTPYLGLLCPGLPRLVSRVQPLDRWSRSRRRPRGPGAAGRPSKREGGNLLSAGDAADDAIVEEPS